MSRGLCPLICLGVAGLVLGAWAQSPVLNPSRIVLTETNGGSVVEGWNAELLTLSTSGTTTDTSANLLPANSVILAVTGYVQTAITTATSWKLGDATTAGRFTAVNSTMTLGATSIGLVHVDQTGAAGPIQSAAAKVRVTCVGTPGAGKIRIVVFYRTYAPSGS